MRFLKTLLILVLVCAPQLGVSQSRIYFLETIDLRGTQRISASDISRELELKPGARLNDETVMTIREKLLGLGLFKSVLLYMRKGSKPNHARLIIEAEDDETVLGRWAIGGEVAVSSGEPKASSHEPNSPSYGYKTSLVARNLFSQGHRASVSTDIDSGFVLREGHIAYGLPSVSRESVQFDGSIHITDVSHRYLNTLGFGQKGVAHWTLDNDGGSIQYGVAMYLNSEGRYDLPGYPTTIAGPKVSYQRETRLLGFIPSGGYSYNLSLLLPPASKGRVPEGPLRLF